MSQPDSDMENLTLDDRVDGGTGLVAAPGLPGSSERGSSLGATSATAAMRRTPGRWRRIPRDTFPKVVFSTKPGVLPTLIGKRPPLPPGVEESWKIQDSVEASEWQKRRGFTWQSCPLRFITGPKGSKEVEEAEEESRRSLLESADKLEKEDEERCDTEEAKVAFRAFKVKFSNFYRSLANTKPEDLVFVHREPSDTQEEHLTAEEMEMQYAQSGRPVCLQARHFATLALNQYNSAKKTCKFEMATVLLSKCFSEVDGTTFAHVNFTATPPQSASHPAKRLFFAELMLIPDLQAYKDSEPMRVLHVCTIDDSCFGGCHEMERDIKEPVRKDMDYDRCHACSERIKHPRGAQFIAGHNRTRMPYVSAFPWTYRSQ